MRDVGVLVHPEPVAAQMLGLSPRTLQRMRLEGGGPAFVQLTAQRVAYTPEALKAWLEARQFPNIAAAKIAKAKAAQA
jgi:hypothetical protein